MDNLNVYLARMGLKVRRVRGDGSCFYRACSVALFGNESQHFQLRQAAMDFILENPGIYRGFLTESLTYYVTKGRQTNTWANHIEIDAISRMYGRRIEIYEYGARPTQNINVERFPNCENPIRLAYWRNAHYDAIVPIDAGYREQLQRRPNPKDAPRYAKRMSLKRPRSLSAMAEQPKRKRPRTTSFENRNSPVEGKITKAYRFSTLSTKTNLNKRKEQFREALQNNDLTVAQRISRECLARTLERLKMAREEEKKKSKKNP